MNLCRPTFEALQRESSVALETGQLRKFTYLFGNSEQPVTLGLIARLDSIYFVTGPQFRGSDAQVTEVLRHWHGKRSGTFTELNAGKPEAAQMQQAPSEAQAIQLLWKLIEAEYGPEVPLPAEIGEYRASAAVHDHYN